MTPAAAGRLPNAAIAAMWMMASIFASTTELVLVHYLGQGWPSPLQLFWRQGTALIVLLPLIVRAGRGAFVTRNFRVIAFRSVCAMSALMLWIYATSHLPLAIATTLSFTRPLWIVLLAWLLLGEQIGRAKWIAMALGFAGVLVMVRPGVSVEAPLAQAAALLASFMFALSFVSIKVMTGDNDPLVIMVYSCLFGVALSGWPAAEMWRTPTVNEGLLLAGLGFTSLTAFGCLLKALTIEGAAALMPLDYLRLPLVVLSGIILFGETLSSATIIGALLILSGALTTTFGRRFFPGRAA